MTTTEKHSFTDLVMAAFIGAAIQGTLAFWLPKVADYVMPEPTGDQIECATTANQDLSKITVQCKKEAK